MLRYFVGRSGEDKTKAIYEEIKTGMDSGFTGKVIVMVPEQFSIQMEYDLMKQMNLSGIMNIDVLSFKRLGYRVFSEVGGDAGTVIDSTGRKMLIQKAFEGEKENLNVFGQVYRRSGFIDAFEIFIKEMKRANLAPEDFLNESGRREDEKLLSGKLSDIHKVFSAYEDLLTDRYYDEEDEMDRLISLIEQADFLNGAVVYVDHFFGFTEQEYKVLGAMLTKVKSMTVTLPIDPELSNDDKDLFYPSYRIFEKLEAIANDLSIPRRKKAFIDSLECKALNHLRSNLFAYDAGKCSDVSGIEITQCQNQHLEVERIASDIIKKIKSGEYAYSDIALSVSDMKRYTMTIKSVFDEFGIPYFIDEKVDISLHPLMVYVSCILRCVEKYYRSEDMIRLLKTGYMPMDDDVAQSLENLIIEKGIQGKRVNKTFEHDLNDDLQSFLGILKDFETAVKGKKTVEDYSRILVDHLVSQRINERLKEQVECFKVAGQIQNAREYAQIWNVFMNILDQLVRLIGDMPINIKDYHTLLLSGISAKKIGLVPEGKDQIIVGDLARSRNKSIKGLYLLGVNDGVLPTVRDSGGILVDDEVMMLIEDGFKLNSSMETFIKEERLSIFATLTKPSEFLSISYPVSDLDGKAQRPSHLIHQIKELYDGLFIEKIEYDYYDSLKLDQLTLNPAIRYMVDALRKNSDGLTVDEGYLSLFDSLMGMEEYKELMEQLKTALTFDNAIKPLGLEHIDKLFSMDAKTSISRLERFEQCPFSHFVDYGLNPHIREPFELRSPELGSIYHFVIESFGQMLKSENLKWKDLNVLELDGYVEKLMDSSLERHKDLFDSSFYYKFIKVKIRRVLLRSLKTLTDHIKQGEFEPAGFELGFPNMVVKLDGGKDLTLQGKIDRVDLLDKDGEGFIKIIDYKSGQKSFELYEVYEGIDLQLMVYLMGAMDISDKLYNKTLNPAGAFYFKIDDPMLDTTIDDKDLIEEAIEGQMKLDGVVVADDTIINAMDEQFIENDASSILGIKRSKGKFSKYSNALPEKAFNRLMEHVKEKVKETGEKIQSGDIRAYPVRNGQRSACDFCQFKSICQFDTIFESNKVRKIEKRSKDEIMEKLMKGSEEDA